MNWNNTGQPISEINFPYCSGNSLKENTGLNKHIDLQLVKNESNSLNLDSPYFIQSSHFKTHNSKYINS